MYIYLNFSFILFTQKEYIYSTGHFSLNSMHIRIIEMNFRYLAYIKVDSNNSINDETITDIMQIYLDIQDIEYSIIYLQFNSDFNQARSQRLQSNLIIKCCKCKLQEVNAIASSNTALMIYFMDFCCCFLRCIIFSIYVTLEYIQFYNVII